MSDYMSSLPVRSEKDGTDERVHVKIVDYTSPDGSGNQVEVSDGNVHAYVHGKDPAGTETLLRTSEAGHVGVDGVYNATTNSDPANIGLVAHTRNATPGDAQQDIRLTGIANSDVRALDVAIRDASGAVFSMANPLPVFVAGSAGGDEILDFNQGSAIAANASSSHTYTPSTGKVLTLQKVAVSASMRCKFEIKMGLTGSEVLKLVLFNSTANPNAEYVFGLPQELADTDSLVIVRTNLDKQAGDVYSTIEGIEN